jgi:hypothetical protein
MIWRADPSAIRISSTILTQFAGTRLRKHVVNYSCSWAHVDHTVVATTPVEPANETAREMNDMAYSLSTPASAAKAHAEATANPHLAAPPAEAASPEVLITEQEVLFGTAAAARVQWRNVSRPERPSRPSHAERAKRYEFLDRARMAREMGRL